MKHAKLSCSLRVQAVTKGYHDVNVRLLQPQTLQNSPPKHARLERCRFLFGTEFQIFGVYHNCQSGTAEGSNSRPENLKPEVLLIEQRVTELRNHCNKLEACKERKSKLERRYDTGG